MKIEKKRFAGRSFNAVQVIPLMWRLKAIMKRDSANNYKKWNQCYEENR